MKIRSLVRFAPAYALVSVLAGCAGQPQVGPIGASGVDDLFPRSVRTEPVAGGTFSGDYSGKDTLSYCWGKNQFFGVFKYSGAGNASFLHRSQEVDGALNAYPTGHPPHGSPWSGGVFLTSAKHPQNRISMVLSEAGPGGITPCGHTFSYTADGGTGKFVHATGTGNVTIQCYDNYTTYSDQWSGTLSF